MSINCPTETQSEEDILQAVDEPMREVVGFLRMHGCKTFASCSGEQGHGFNYPHVRMETRDPKWLGNLLVSHGYRGFYIKEWRSSEKLEMGVEFIEIEFWSLTCAFPYRQVFDSTPVAMSAFDGPSAVLEGEGK